MLKWRSNLRWEQCIRDTVSLGLLAKCIISNSDLLFLLWHICRFLLYAFSAAAFTLKAKPPFFLFPPRPVCETWRFCPSPPLVGTERAVRRSVVRALSVQTSMPRPRRSEPYDEAVWCRAAPGVPPDEPLFLLFDPAEDGGWWLDRALELFWFFFSGEAHWNQLVSAARCAPAVSTVTCSAPQVGDVPLLWRFANLWGSHREPRFMQRTRLGWGESARH